MDIGELEALFDEFNGEFHHFERVEVKRSSRSDLHAFMLLDNLVPGIHRMVSSAEHDEIYLEVGAEDVAPVITREQVLELIRCGVRYEDSGFRMFV